jgi:HEAT repeat protein
VRIAAMSSAERYVRRIGADNERAAPLAAAVARRLKAPGWQERADAVRALGRLSVATMSTALVGALGDSSPFVREAAARALGQLKRSDALAPLVAVSHDEVAEVRIAAAHALHALNVPRARERLAQMAKDDPEPRVRAAASRP